MSSLRAQRKARLARALARLNRQNLPGIEAELIRGVLQQEADRRLAGGDHDLPNASIFGDSHRQSDMFERPVGAPGVDFNDKSPHHHW